MIVFNYYLKKTNSKNEELDILSNLKRQIHKMNMEQYNLPDEINHAILMFSVEPHSADRLAIMAQIRDKYLRNILEVIHISQNQKDLILNQLSPSKTITHLYDDALLGTKTFDGLKVGPRVRIRQHLSTL